MEPNDQREEMIKTEGKNESDEATLTRVEHTDIKNLFIVTFEVKAKNHALVDLKYVNSCARVYSWIWIMCTQATRDKLKTVPSFAGTKRSKDFIELITATKGITLQLESHKDLSTALPHSLACILKCRQGPIESLTRYEQRFAVATAIFFTYGGSLAFPSVYKREMTAQKLTKLSADPGVLVAFLEKISNKALARIFLGSLDDTRYGELKSRIKNIFAEAGNIYPADVADMLTRAQNYSIQKKPFVRNRDALIFATSMGVPYGGRTNERRRVQGGHRNSEGAKTCYQFGCPHLIREYT